MVSFFEKFIKKMKLYSEQQQDRRAHQLATKNKEAHDKGGSSKPFETYLAPPSFTLYLWAALPLLFIATSNTKFAIAAIIATVLNYVLIHLDTFPTIKYLITGIVLIILFLMHFFAVL